MPFSVIPAKAGIQSLLALLDSRSRSSPGQASFSGSDNLESFSRVHTRM